MVDNPTKIYNDYVRANLPNSMSYDTGTDRYDINSHSFFKFKNSNWYFNYISKYGYSALSAYAVNNFEPALVFDFKGNYFRKSATASTFGASITHAASTNATMVDSDGLLKWRPHNLINKSNTFDTWNKDFSTVTANNATGPDGVANTADTITFNATTNNVYNLAFSPFSAGDKVTIALWVRSDTLTTLQISFNGRANAANNTLGGTVAVTSTWALVSVEATVAGNDTGLYFILGTNPYLNPATVGTFEAYGAHMFRSDLGGMVNNPDTTNSYVPTTTAAAYLSRRGHHHYNGSAWVNEGILHESEARTNLYLKSNQFVSPWALIGSTVTASAGTSPSGLADAWRWVGNGTSILYQNTAYAAGDYTMSAWVKSNGAGEDTFRFYGRNQLYSGDFTATSEWVRYSFTFNSASAVNQFSGIIYGASRENVDLLVYGFQIEAASTASSYIPTTTASVTRAAETLTVPAANLPYDSTNMSIQMDGKMTYAADGSTNTALPWRWRLNSSNILYNTISTAGTRTGQPRFVQSQTTSGFDEVLGANNVYTPDTNVPFNFAGRYGSTFLNGAHEGTLLTANTTPTILPDLSSTDLELGYLFMGTIGEFRMWSDDLGDVGITEATLPSTEPSLSLTFDGSETSFTVLDWSE